MNTSPKMNHDTSVYMQNNWYSYYAGYADGFIKEAIEEYGKCFKNPILLDPWNGSGTTTLVASMLNLSCYGFDINPAMIVVSKAKLYDVRALNVEYIQKQLLSICPLQLSEQEYSDDPLNTWFSLESLSAIRLVEEKIQNITSVSQKDRKLRRIKDICCIEMLSNEVCCFYLAFFTTLKQFGKVFVGSNPTWIKSKNIEKLTLNISDIVSVYLNNIENMKKEYSTGVNSKNIYLAIGDSKDIPLKNGSIDMVIASPPYCTRIDYAIYTKIELSLLGYSNFEVQNLRRKMIGTPTIRKNTIYDDISQNIPLPEISECCFRTMNSISAHYSKAAKSYYYKTYAQYFSGMYLSMQEIYRVLNYNGIAVIVVQDSWFKDIHVDLPGIVSEFGQSCGFSILSKTDFCVKNNLNYINSKSRKYKSVKQTVESVIILKKR
ncbi:MAG: hypothetical protein PHR06_09665 [Candidatus Cloacimonetes bacterium]|nr:hypothetical protein [Candidatus Cloacimonadota bacterium]